MSPRLRFLLTALLIVVLSALTCLGALTWLDHRLDLPAVQQFDATGQARLHALANSQLTRLMIAFTWIGSIKIFATSLTLVLAFLFKRKRRHAAALLAFAITGAFILNETLKLHFHRARPRVPWAIGDEHTFSFPSGHSLFAFVLYGTLVYLALRHATSMMRRVSLLVPALVLIVGIGTSRIYLGMHFPTDVASGYLTGALWLTAVIAIDQLWRRTQNRTINPSPDPTLTP